MELLLPEIDEQKTKDNVKKLLKKYPTFKRRSTSPFESQITPLYSFDTRVFTGTINKAIERHVTEKVYWEQKVSLIEEAVNKIHDAHLRRLLIEKYLKLRGRYNKVTDTSLQLDWNCSASEFYRLQEEALLHFADVYNNGELLVFEK